MLPGVLWLIETWPAAISWCIEGSRLGVNVIALLFSPAPLMRALLAWPSHSMEVKCCAFRPPPPKRLPRMLVTLTDFSVRLDSPRAMRKSCPPPSRVVPSRWIGSDCSDAMFCSGLARSKTDTCLVSKGSVNNIYDIYIVAPAFWYMSPSEHSPWSHTRGCACWLPDFKTAQPKLISTSISAVDSQGLCTPRS